MIESHTVDGYNLVYGMGRQQKISPNDNFDKLIQVFEVFLKLLSSDWKREIICIWRATYRKHEGIKNDENCETMMSLTFSIINEFVDKNWVVCCLTWPKATRKPARARKRRDEASVFLHSINLHDCAVSLAYINYQFSFLLCKCSRKSPTETVETGKKTVAIIIRNHMKLNRLLDFRPPRSVSARIHLLALVPIIDFCVFSFRQFCSQFFDS